MSYAKEQTDKFWKWLQTMNPFIEYSNELRKFSFYELLTMADDKLHQIIPNERSLTLFKVILQIEHNEFKADCDEKREYMKPKEILYRPVNGLQNQGNTCFFNSALQSLLHSEKFIEYFLAQQKIDKCGKYKLLNAWIHFCHRYYPQSSPQKRQTKIKPNNLLNCLAVIDPDYNNRNQECCYFLLLTLLNNLDSQLLMKHNGNTKCANNMMVTNAMNESYEVNTFVAAHNPNQSSIVRGLMHGIKCETKSCGICGDEQRYYSSFRELTIPIIDDMIKIDVMTIFIIKENKISIREIKNISLLDNTTINTLKYKIQQYVKNKSKSKINPSLVDIDILSIEPPESVYSNDANCWIKTFDQRNKCSSITNTTFAIVNIAKFEIHIIITFVVQNYDDKPKFVVNIVKKNIDITKKYLHDMKPDIAEDLFQVTCYCPDNVILVVYSPLCRRNIFEWLSERIDSTLAIQKILTGTGIKLNDIKACLHLFYQELVYDINCYSFPCANCGEAKIINFKKTIVKSPKVLILLLNRTYFTDTAAVKIGHFVNYPIKSFHLTAKDTYNLFAVCSHYGNSTKSGHYVAYVKAIGTNDWYYTSDATVYPINIQKVVNSNAIVLMYELDC